jgi:hypothetical protein
METPYARDLAFEFLEKFARFECGMKEAGYCIPERKERRAGVDWKRFYEEKAGRLTERPSASLANAMAYLLAHPPEVQLYEEDESGNGRAVFRPLALKDKGDGEQVLEAVRRVRNNLFHGGKHTYHSPEERNDELLRHAVVVLDAASQLEGQISNIYWSGY